MVSNRLELKTFWAALFCFMTKGLDWHRLQNRMIFHSNNLIVSFSFSKRPKSRLGGFRRKRSTLESCSQTDNSNTTDKKYLVTSYINFFFMSLWTADWRSSWMYTLWPLWSDWKDLSLWTGKVHLMNEVN